MHDANTEVLIIFQYNQNNWEPKFKLVFNN